MEEIYCSFCGEELEVISVSSKTLLGCNCLKSIGMFWDSNGVIYGAPKEQMHKYALESKAHKKYKKWKAERKAR